MDNAHKTAPDEELPTKEQITNNDSNYPPKLKRPYDKILTDLSEEDLKSPGVYKLILAKSSELEYENYELKKSDTIHRDLQVAYATASTELRLLKTTKKSFDLLFSAALGSGTCMIGLAFSVYSASNLGAFIVGGLGFILSALAVGLVIFGGAKNEV
jgi:hypothetical protein